MKTFRKSQKYSRIGNAAEYAAVTYAGGIAPE
jgi:hypothetical protein